MRQVRMLARIAIGILAFVAIAGLISMQDAGEEKVVERMPDPILSPLVLELWTPTATATAVSFPARGQEAAVEPKVLLDAYGDPIDFEFCRKIRESGLYPQTKADAVSLYGAPVDGELVPLDENRVSLIPYYRCVDHLEKYPPYAYWAVDILDGPPTRVKIPSGMGYTIARINRMRIPPREPEEGVFIEGTTLQISGPIPESIFN